MIKYVYHPHSFTIIVWRDSSTDNLRRICEMSRNSIAFVIEIDKSFTKIMTCTGEIGYVNNEYIYNDCVDVNNM